MSQLLINHHKQKQEVALKLKEKHFSTQTLITKYHISKPRWALTLFSPPSDTNVQMPKG